MAKVTITLTIDVPDIDDHSDEELAQNLFDDVIKYVEVSHLVDACKCIAKSDMSSMDYQIHEHHLLWAEIMRTCEWTLERENEHG